MGRRLVKGAGEMGCRDYRAAAPSVGAERPDVRHSAFILGIPLSLILPRSAISEPVTKPIPRSVLRVLKVVSVGRALNVICANPTRRISWITELPAPAARLKCLLKYVSTECHEDQFTVLTPQDYSKAGLAQHGRTLGIATRRGNQLRPMAQACQRAEQLFSQFPRTASQGDLPGDPKRRAAALGREESRPC